MKPLISDEDIKNLTEIQRLLDEGLKHYLEYESHCKSSEGYVSIEVSFGTSWERFEAAEKGVELKPKYNVNVYSYALSPSRSWDFDYPEDALEKVREWHAAEMAYDYQSEENMAIQAEMDQLAVDFIGKMQSEGRLHVEMIGTDDES